MKYMSTERIPRPISNSVPFDLSHGYSMKEVPSSFINPWMHFLAQICKNSSVDERPDFISKSPSSGFGIPTVSTILGETTWKISKKVSENKSVERKVVIQKRNGAPNVEEIELVEINQVSGSTGSRRVLAKFDPLDCTITSIIDERVIVTKKDWLAENDEFEMNRVVYGWNVRGRKPKIITSEHRNISRLDLTSLPEDVLMTEGEFKKLVNNIEKGQPINDKLTYPNSWLTTCFPPDSSIMP